MPILTRPEFDITSLRLEETELIFRLPGGGGYRKAVLDASIRQHLADVLRQEYANHNLGGQQDWEEWDYSNEALPNGKLLFPWRAETLEEMDFLLSPGALQRIEDMSQAMQSDAYFVDFMDSLGNHLIAAKEMRTLKSVQKKKLSLFSDGRMTLLGEEVFQIGSNFNFIFDSNNVFIFNPKTFETLVGLDEIVNKAVDQNITEFSSNCTTVHWPNMPNVKNKSKRFSRYLRSIINRGEYNRFNIDKIKSGLRRNGIQFTEHSDGKIEPHPDYELDFIKFLDHTIFDIEITDEPATPYEATNRKRKL